MKSMFPNVLKDANSMEEHLPYIGGSIPPCPNIN
jgi:hypothetical protein